MPNALPLTPALVDNRVSIARLHGEACFDCGVVNRVLRAAGHAVVRGTTRVWPISTCGCRSQATAA